MTSTVLAISMQHHSAGDLVVVPVMLSKLKRITRDVAYSFRPTVGVCLNRNEDGTFDVFVDGTKRRFRNDSVVHVNDASCDLSSVEHVTSGVVPQMFGVVL